MTEEQITAARATPRAQEVLKWRKSLSMDKYKDIKKKVNDAGIDIAILCFNMNEAITDDEIEYAFTMAKALGAKAISTTTQVTVSKRVAPFADVQDLGALLQRARFALPVVDADIVTVTYADPLALMRELRAMGAANALRARPTPFDTEAHRHHELMFGILEDAVFERGLQVLKSACSHRGRSAR